MSRRAAIRVLPLSVLIACLLSAAPKKEKQGAKPAAPAAAATTVTAAATTGAAAAVTGTAPAASGAAATLDPKSYVIGAEDILLISVWRDAELSRQVMVRPDGRITLQLLGEVQAAG